jgi:predicted DNA-binding antitoxin AbrB/MazE fold protein
MTIRAIYEHGVFKPTGKVDLPDRTAVEFDPKILSNAENDAGSQKRIYEMLHQSFDTGRTDAAQRHNEHQL